MVVLLVFLLLLLFCVSVRAVAGSAVVRLIVKKWRTFAKKKRKRVTYFSGSLSSSTT